jgi:macrodomain Ter protein organizer (MatP/YcbG family)
MCDGVLPGKISSYISADEDTIVEFMLEVASYKNEPDKIERWLKEHVTTMEN